LREDVSVRPGINLETDRLVLQPLTSANCDEYVALHADAEVTRFLRVQSPGEALERLINNEQEWAEYGYGLFAVIDRQTGRFVGRTGLKYWPQFDEVEVGWLLRRDAWGNGYATEAARACINWGFELLSAPYLTAMIRVENTRSIAVAERVGMTMLRTDELLGDPVVVYAINRDN
jgi:RimJ/RimL family protein N-acetyltransferase